MPLPVTGNQAPLQQGKAACQYLREMLPSASGRFFRIWLLPTVFVCKERFSHAAFGKAWRGQFYRQVGQGLDDFFCCGASIPNGGGFTKPCCHGRYLLNYGYREKCPFHADSRSAAAKRLAPSDTRGRHSYRKKTEPPCTPCRTAAVLNRGKAMIFPPPGSSLLFRFCGSLCSAVPAEGFL